MDTAARLKDALAKGYAAHVGLGGVSLGSALQAFRMHAASDDAFRKAAEAELKRCEKAANGRPGAGCTAFIESTNAKFLRAALAQNEVTP